MLLIALLLLFLMFLLIALGEPIRFLLLRRLNLFSHLDFMEICILDIYLSGFILYMIAMLPFPLFNLLTAIFLTAFCLLFTAFIHYKSLINLVKPCKIIYSLKINSKQLFDYTIVFMMFSFILLINFVALADFVFGSVCDESLHSLMVTVILENNHVPVTLKPYSSEGITYPQASHAIFAFAVYILNMSVPKVVFYVSVLFKALSVVGAYCLGKKLGSNRLYSLGLSFIFTFISSWPLSVVWGGNPFLVGFPLFLMCLGLLFSLFCFREEHIFAELVAVGLLFGYAGAIIISYLQTLIAVAFLVVFYYFVRKHGQTKHFLLKFVTIFGVSLLPISPFLYRFFAFYPYPGHNIGLPSDFGGWMPQQFYLTQALHWAFENLSPHLSLRVLMMLFLAGFSILLWKTRGYGNVKVVAFALAVFVAATLLSFISFFLSGDFGVISWGHQGIILSIPINILILAFYFKLASLFREYNFKWLSKFRLKSSSATALLTLMLLLPVTVPFMYHRVFLDADSLRGAYNMFAVTTQSDYDLMLWMKHNLTSGSVILVHPYEPGLFIPSISNHKIIFPFSGSRLSKRYQTLVSLLENNTLITTEYNAYQLMHDLGVTHVFVGANVVYWMFNHSKWNPKLFLGNPNFKLAKNFDNAYLFKFEEYDPNVVFMDDFEYQTWEQNRWQNNSSGNGLGNVTLAAGFGQGESRCLKITAQATPTVWNWDSKYVYWVSREIFVFNNSDVTFSFYLDAREGFGGKDTFAILILDINNSLNTSRSIVITTPNGVYDGFACAIHLDGYYGSFSFDLSREWQRIFSSPLPNTFILQFANYDFNGIPNVAYVDNIKVTSTLSGC